MSKIIFSVVFVLICSVNNALSENLINDMITSEQRLVHCSRKLPNEKRIIRRVHIEQPHIVKKRSIDQPLRISVFYDDSVYSLDPEKLHIINNTLLPEAIKYWEQALKVRKTGGPIKLNRQCASDTEIVIDGRVHCIDACAAETFCEEMKVPEHHLNPCYVCNSTSDECGTLPRISQEGPGGPPVIEEEPTGVENADFVLYLSAIQTRHCQRDSVASVAYASHCQQESALDRPIAGHANICPEAMSTKQRDLPAMLSALKHEILHALGFSPYLYAFYRDDNGEPLTKRIEGTEYSGEPPYDEEQRIHKWSDRVVKTITRDNWMVRGGTIKRTFQMIVTPRVVKEVRDHFNCSTLEGAELEDQGGRGTALAHWEKRVFENEAMTGTYTQDSVFSRVTLALMEDTGWYRAEYRLAAPLHWGRGLGCGFAQASCKQWINSQRGKDPAPFCDTVQRTPFRTECSTTRNAVTKCNMNRHDYVLPEQYQHFENLSQVPAGEVGRYGGTVWLADYCPFKQDFAWRVGNGSRTTHCGFQDNSPNDNFLLESYGQSSKCFTHGKQVWRQRSSKQIREWAASGSGCYQYNCENGKLHIKVSNYSFTCINAGQVLQVGIIREGWRHEGGVVCPPCGEMCGEEFASRGEYCEGDAEVPPSLHNDVLKCGVAALTASSILLTAAILANLKLNLQVLLH